MKITISDLLPRNFFTVPEVAGTYMLSDSLKKVLDLSGGKIAACGEDWRIISKEMLFGVHRVLFGVHRVWLEHIPRR